MAQPEDHGDRTTIYRREDTLPEGTQEEFGHYMVVIGGAGLGLAISKGLIEAHGGRIWIHDGAASGTTVSFTLPIA